MTETDAVEDVAASLVREYLSRKGLKGTLKMMDEEAPRGNMSISNRQALMKELNIDRLMRNNKSQPRPYRAMLEVMTKSFLDDPSVTPGIRSSSTSPENVKQSPSTRTYDPVDRRNARSKLSTNDLQSEIHTLTSTGHSSSSSQRQKSAEYRRPIAGLTGGRSSHSSSDLVIDDNVESETLLGEGKAALMDRTPSAKLSSGRTATVQSTQPRPRSSVKTRGIGMAGPVCSNIDDSRRKFHKPRNLSAPSKQSDWRDDLQSMPNGLPLANSLSSGPSESSVTRPRVDMPLHAASATDMDNSDLALSKSKKEQLQELLKADPEKAKSSHHIKKRDKSQFERRDSGEVTVPQEETPAYNVRSSSITTQRPKSSHPTSNGILRKSSLTSLNSASTKMGDLEIGEVDDLDGELADLDLAPRVQSTSRPMSKTFEGFPIDMRSAINLKMLIFGSAAQSFNDEWRYQSFTFSDFPHLMYGMVQKKGGPCGVLAAVQAVILQEMLFIKERLPKHKWDEPSREDRSGCLARALSRILWRAGENRKAVVALEGNKANFDGGSRFKEDGLTEKLTLFTFTELEKLQAFLKDVIRQFELDGHSGVVLALYSAILSRGVDRIVGDMDEPTNKLMGAHGYCTQDMVNLFLTGRAVSNVFNDVMELDSGGLGKPMILRGIAARNDIGLLSLFEHYRSCQVGTYYKTPRYPIWVVCSESHFSVLFSVRKDLVNDWKAERRFDLFYYDGLAKQDEPIKLTIDTTNRYYQPPSDQDLVPPLEHCIRTKWKDAEIDWNGTDPIL